VRAVADHAVDTTFATVAAATARTRTTASAISGAVASTRATVSSAAELTMHAFASVTPASVVAAASNAVPTVLEHIPTAGDVAALPRRAMDAAASTAARFEHRLAAAADRTLTVAAQFSGFEIAAESCPQEGECPEEHKEEKLGDESRRVLRRVVVLSSQVRDRIRTRASAAAASSRATAVHTVDAVVGRSLTVAAAVLDTSILVPHAVMARASVFASRCRQAPVAVEHEVRCLSAIVRHHVLRLAESHHVPARVTDVVLAVLPNSPASVNENFTFEVVPSNDIAHIPDQDVPVSDAACDADEEVAVTQDDDDEVSADDDAEQASEDGEGSVSDASTVTSSVASANTSLVVSVASANMSRVD